MLSSILVLCYALHTTPPRAAPLLYQLQEAHYESLMEAPFGIGVVDWEDAALTKKEIQALKSQGKTLVSYLSIGEAEDYRDYWQDVWSNTPPPFLEKENAEWQGNFKVHYWDATWQAIILKKVEAIALQGYDGVYLDIIDGYWYFEEKGRATAKQEMIDFVIRISKAAKKIRPNFMVIPQNSPELIESHAYLDAIDGLGKEDTWYNDDELQDKENQEYELHYLRRAKKSGKFILAVDYPTNPSYQKDFLRKTVEEGFIPFVGTRALDKSSISPYIACTDMKPD